MTDAKVIQPRGWPPPRGYSNGIIGAGRVLSIAGQIGWDPASGAIVSADFTAQTAQALRNVVSVLRAAGGEPEHLVRLTWFITDRGAYVEARGAIGEAYREIVGKHYPAMSVLIVDGLVEPDARVEIEATAILPE